MTDTLILTLQMALFARRYQQMKDKTALLEANPVTISIIINKNKTKIIKIYTKTPILKWKEPQKKKQRDFHI